MVSSNDLSTHYSMEQVESKSGRRDPARLLQLKTRLMFIHTDYIPSSHPLQTYLDELFHSISDYSDHRDEVFRIPRRAGASKTCR